MDALRLRIELSWAQSRDGELIFVPCPGVGNKTRSCMHRRLAAAVVAAAARRAPRLATMLTGARATRLSSACAARHSPRPAAAGATPTAILARRPSPSGRALYGRARSDTHAPHRVRLTPPRPRAALLLHRKCTLRMHGSRSTRSCPPRRCARSPRGSRRASTPTTLHRARSATAGSYLQWRYGLQRGCSARFA